jgi:hypothetical protein
MRHRGRGGSAGQAPAPWNDIFQSHYHLERMRSGLTVEDVAALEKKYGYQPNQVDGDFLYGRNVLGRLQSIENLRTGDPVVSHDHCDIEAVMKGQFKNHPAYIYCSVNATLYVGGVVWKINSLFISDITSSMNSFLRTRVHPGSFRNMILPEL